MTHYLAASLVVTVSLGVAFAQAQTTSAVAYLYFSDYAPGYASLTPGKARTQIEGYSVAADGSLTKIPGSPFASGGYNTQICVNGKYLFASTHIEIGNGQYPGNMNSYRIGSNGALTLSHVLGNANLTNITLDHTGETLYGQKGGQGDLLSYDVRWSDGGLEYLGQATAPDLELSGAGADPVTFASNDEFAFGTTVDKYQRISVHKLIGGYSTGDPQPQSLAVAADPNENLAGVLNLGFDSSGVQHFGVASYQIAPDGDLTTTTTTENTPAVNFKTFDTLSMSPSGEFLAVAGLGGVQIFHWNGADPATPFAQMSINYYPGVPNEVAGVPGDAVILVWDNANHLFAYEEGVTPSPSGVNGYLYVWTVTESGVTNAPGSPLEFQNPISTVVNGPGMAVQALTKQTD